MTHLGILSLAAGLLWLVTPVWTEGSAASKDKIQNKTSVKTTVGKTQSRAGAKSTTQKTQKRTSVKAPTRKTQGAYHPERPTYDARRSAYTGKWPETPEGTGYYQGSRYRDKRGHAPDGTYVDGAGKLQYSSPVQRPKPPRSGSPSQTSGSGSSAGGGWGGPPPTNPAEGGTGKPFTKPPGSSTAGEVKNVSPPTSPPSGGKGSSSWGGAPPPNPAKGQSGKAFDKPAGNASTSGEVRR
jgi:hypothetical protein